MAEKLSTLKSSRREWRRVSRQTRESINSHLAARPELCRNSTRGEALPNYAAVRDLASFGYNCVVSHSLSNAAKGEIGALARDRETWSVPEAIFSAQVADTAQGDPRQSSEDVTALRIQARDALSKLLAGTERAYYGGMPASLTELSMASAVLTSWSDRPSDTPVAEATVRAMTGIALLQGRVPDQPEANSAVDGYLAAVVRSQLSGKPVDLGPRLPQPKPTTSARNLVRFYLDASLRATDPISAKVVRRDVRRFLTHAENPLDMLTVATAATLALQRTDEPCAVVEPRVSGLDEALASVVDQYAPSSDAVRAWLTLLWTATKECGPFRQQTAPAAGNFLDQLSATRATATPTGQAVADWGARELTCTRNQRIARPRSHVTVASFAADTEPGDGLGLGIYAAIHAHAQAATSCAGSLPAILKEAD